MIRDLTGKTVLITGGTKGIGLATGLAFAQQGARCVLTYRWGNADEGELLARFAAAGAPAPRLIQADAGNQEDTEALMQTLRKTDDSIDVFVSNVTGAALVSKLEDLTERALLKTMQYTAYPTIGYLNAIKRSFGKYPRHVVAVSSPGPDHFYGHYDLVAAGKAALEAMCRYAACRLHDEGVRLNVVRTIGIKTTAFQEAFGAEFSTMADRVLAPELRVTEDDVAKAILALCSGMLDGMSGQVIDVDRGLVFVDNVMRLFEDRDKLTV